MTWQKGGYRRRFRVFYELGQGWVWQLESHSQVLARAPQYYPTKAACSAAARRVKEYAVEAPVVQIPMRRSVYNRYVTYAKDKNLDAFYALLAEDEQAAEAWRSR